MTNTILALCGELKIPCRLYTFSPDGYATWYVPHGAKQINLTYDVLQDGVDIMEISDVDALTVKFPIFNETHIEAEFTEQNPINHD